MNDLIFVSSQSIEQFKQSNLIDKIDVKRNPKTEKLFFTYVGGIGAVAKSFDNSKPKLISVVKDSQGVEFKMLHNEGTANVEFSL